jgi:hypothetical protein
MKVVRDDELYNVKIFTAFGCYLSGRQRKQTCFGDNLPDKTLRLAAKTLSAHDLCPYKEHALERSALPS